MQQQIGMHFDEESCLDHGALIRDPDEEIHAKIDQMINKKKGPVKKFNNNPVKRETEFAGSIKPSESTRGLLNT